MLGLKSSCLWDLYVASLDTSSFVALDPVSIASGVCYIPGHIWNVALGVMEQEFYLTQCFMCLVASLPLETAMAGDAERQSRQKQRFNSLDD